MEGIVILIIQHIFILSLALAIAWDASEEEQKNKLFS